MLIYTKNTVFFKNKHRYLIHVLQLLAIAAHDIENNWTFVRYFCHLVSAELHLFFLIFFVGTQYGTTLIFVVRRLIASNLTLLKRSILTGDFTLLEKCGDCGPCHTAKFTNSLQESHSASARAVNMRDGRIISASRSSEATAWFHTYARTHSCRETAFES